MEHKTYNIEQKGISLYLTIVVIGVLTTALLALITISVSQIKIIWTLGDSAVAFYAADTGIERVLYAIYQEGYSPTTLNECLPAYSDSLNGAQYQVCVSDISTSTIWSTGSYKNTKRRIEINF